MSRETSFPSMRACCEGRGQYVVDMMQWRCCVDGCPIFSFLPCGSLLVLLVLLGLALLGLHGGVVDIPDEDGLEDNGDEDDEEDGEEDGLVVEDSDSLVGGSDGGEPVELTHFWGC